MEFDAQSALNFVRENREYLVRIGVVMRWNPRANPADAARVCYLPIEVVQSLVDEYNRLQIVGYPMS